ncbi:hypothetical protein NMY22_g1690 [Coprinellus aureogranulatus]|nr:hypothetical protein NMY22_g1690 [Coprinellus aureogranulatus]
MGSLTQGGPWEDGDGVPDGSQDSMSGESLVQLRSSQSSVFLSVWQSLDCSSDERLYLREIGANTSGGAEDRTRYEEQMGKRKGGVEDGQRTRFTSQEYTAIALQLTQAQSGFLSLQLFVHYPQPSFGLACWCAGTLVADYAGAELEGDTIAIRVRDVETDAFESAGRGVANPWDGKRGSVEASRGRGGWKQRAYLMVPAKAPKPLPSMCNVNLVEQVVAAVHTVCEFSNLAPSLRFTARESGFSASQVFTLGMHSLLEWSKEKTVNGSHPEPDTHTGTTQKRVERKRIRYVEHAPKTRYGAATRVSTSIRDRVKGVYRVYATSLWVVDLQGEWIRALTLENKSESRRRGASEGSILYCNPSPAAVPLPYPSSVVNVHDTRSRYTPNRPNKRRARRQRTVYPRRVQRRVVCAWIAYQAPKKREVTEGAQRGAFGQDETRTVEDTAAVKGAIWAGLRCELSEGEMDIRHEVDAIDFRARKWRLSHFFPVIVPADRKTFDIIPRADAEEREDWRVTQSPAFIAVRNTPSTHSNLYDLTQKAFAAPVDERIGTWLENAARAGPRSDFHMGVYHLPLALWSTYRYTAAKEDISMPLEPCGLQVARCPRMAMFVCRASLFPRLFEGLDYPLGTAAQMSTPSCPFSTRLSTPSTKPHHADTLPVFRAASASVATGVKSVSLIAGGVRYVLLNHHLYDDWSID